MSRCDQCGEPVQRHDGNRCPTLLIVDEDSCQKAGMARRPEQRRPESY